MQGQWLMQNQAALLLSRQAKIRSFVEEGAAVELPEWLRHYSQTRTAEWGRRRGKAD